MKVRVLGTAAGGGLPQWNCACAGCRTARHQGFARTQDCLAVSGDGRAWYLVNASPDLRTQLLAAPELAPGPGPRDTPVRGVLLSTAELDHTLGLLTLREAGGLSVYGSAAVLHALESSFPIRGIMSAYTVLDWHVVAGGETVELDGGLQAQPVPVGTKRPRYAAAAPGDEWVLAYRITDPRTGGVLVYAPCLPAWSPRFATAVAGAGCVLVDGTFLDEDELAVAVGGGPTATAMGHLPVVRSLPLLTVHSGHRYHYTHVNNTNPLATAGPAVPAARVAADGQEFTL